MITEQDRPQERLLPLREICRRYAVSGRTIDRWLETGLLPEPVRINKYRYWRTSDLENFERQRLSANAPDAA